MPRPDALVEVNDAPPPVAAGIVTKAPASDADTMEVAVPSRTGELRAAIVTHWISRGLPEEGDDVLVIHDEDGEPWVISTRPAA